MEEVKKLDNYTINDLCEIMDGQKGLIRFLIDKVVRYNVIFEDLHAGKLPRSKIGDFSDVKVVTPYGEIPWNDVSHLSDKEMRKLMLQFETSMHSMFIKVIPELMEEFQEVNDNQYSFMEGLEKRYEKGVSWDWKDYNKTM